MDTIHTDTWTLYTQIREHYVHRHLDTIHTYTRNPDMDTIHTDKTETQTKTLYTQIR